MSDEYTGDLVVMVGGRNHFMKASDLLRRDELPGEPSDVMLDSNFVQFAQIVTAAMRGDLVFKCTPATVDAETTDQNTEGYTRTVLVTLETAEGDIHQWYDGVVPVTIADTAAGTASIEEVNPEMSGGQMAIEISLAGAWAATNTNTLSVTEATILGYTVAAATSIETSIDT